MASLNRVVIVGNLTRDPELKALPSGMSVCRLGVAVNHRRKNQQTGEWVEEPNYFDVEVFGNQADNCARYLSKGRGVAVDGRLRWRQWEAQDGTKRSAVDIVADNVQFIGPRDGGDFAAGQRSARQGGHDTPPGDMGGTPPGDYDEPDDDIPF